MREIRSLRLKKNAKRMIHLLLKKKRLYAKKKKREQLNKLIKKLKLWNFQKKKKLNKGINL